MANTNKAPPSHQVALLKKSAVLLVPKTVPNCPAPPNEPASPPPLLDCSKTTITSKIEMIIETVINNVYIINSKKNVAREGFEPPTRGL